MTFDFAVTGCLVEHDGQFLIVQESKPGREGLYNFPSGHIDDDETIAEATIREVKEESGYDVELTGFVGLYQSIYADKGLNVAGPVFVATVIGGEAQTSAAHPEVRWVSGPELVALAESGRFWTKYPPLVIADYERRGSLPLDVVSSKRY